MSTISKNLIDTKISLYGLSTVVAFITQSFINYKATIFTQILIQFKNDLPFLW